MKKSKQRNKERALNFDIKVESKNQNGDVQKLTKKRIKEKRAEKTEE